MKESDDRTTKNRDLNDEFLLYAEMTMPASAGIEQYTQTRRAFFAGASVALSRFMGHAKDATIDDGVAEFMRMRKEIEAFAEDVKGGDK